MAQSSPPASLPPAAQEALNKGIIAAKVPDYLLAIRYFEDARKISPDSPVVYLNLGVAESKIPLRELRAIAWLGAYLAALPNASNAAAVKEQITVLEVKNQSNVSHLIKAAQDAASSSKWNRTFMLTDVSTLWAKSGDIAAAFSTIDLQKDDIGGISRASTLAQISAVQARGGDVSGAKTTANMIQRGVYKTKSLKEIGMAQTDAKDIGGARLTLLAAFQTAGLIENRQDRGYEQNAIARAQIDAGDFSAAHDTLLSALKTADLIPVQTPTDAMVKASIQRPSGDLYVAIQDVASARAAFLSAYNNSKLMADADDRSYQQSNIAISQAKGGDLANAAQTLSAAQASANLVQGERKTIMLRLVDRAREEFAEAQIKVGDFTGAKKTADFFADGDQKKGIEKAIAEAQTKIAVADVPVPTPPPPPSNFPPKPIISVSDWLSVLGYNSPQFSRYSAQLNSAAFLDLVGYLKSLPASDDPQKVFDGLFKTADAFVSAQTTVVEMLKQQLAR